MKCKIMIAALLMAAATAQSAQEGHAQEASARGFWADPFTGLMWAGKDNGSDVSWKDAVKYCRDLRLGGYSDWRLGSLEEMKGIFEKAADAPGTAGMHGDVKTMWHVKGDIFLTGNQWTSTRVPGDRRSPSGYAYRFDFNEGRAFDGDELYFRTFKRALCVRGIPKTTASR